MQNGAVCKAIDIRLPDMPRAGGPRHDPKTQYTIAAGWGSLRRPTYESAGFSRLKSLLVIGAVSQLLIVDSLVNKSAREANWCPADFPT